MHNNPNLDLVNSVFFKFHRIVLRYSAEADFEIKGHNSVYNRWILSSIELDLYLMITDMKYTETKQLCPLDVYACQFQMDERISFKFSP